MYPVLEIHIFVFPKGTPLLNWYNYTDNLPGIRLLYTYMYVFVTWWRIYGITLCIDVALFFCCIFGALSIKNDLLQKITIMQARVQRLLHKKVSVHHYLLYFQYILSCLSFWIRVHSNDGVMFESTDAIQTYSGAVICFTYLFCKRRHQYC